MTHLSGRFSLGSALLAVALLAGCGGGETGSGPDAFVPGSHPRFDPAGGDVLLLSDLAFAVATGGDGTADLGTPTDATGIALNQLDGFSTSAYFDIPISGGVDPTSAVAPGSVWLIELASGGGDALNIANIVGAVGLASHDVRVVSLDGGTGNTLRIRPLRPLKPRTKYLVALTRNLRDAGGSRLTRSWSYNALRDPSYPVAPGLMPVRNALLAWESLAAGFIAQQSAGAQSAAEARETLVLTSAFTTTDPLSGLVAMAAPRATIADWRVAEGFSAAAAVASAVALDAGGLLPTPAARNLAVSGGSALDLSAVGVALVPNVGRILTGYIQLPYYQTSAAGLPFGAFLERHWRPDRTLAAALGVTVPPDVDGSFNVTYRYPFAARTGDESVPLQVTLPRDSWVPGYAGAASCGQIYAATGYPTILYVHPVAGDRTSVIGLAHHLASRCIATVAIDLPTHGVAADSSLVNLLNVERNPLFAGLYGANAPHERHFNVAGAIGAPTAMNFAAPGAADVSGTHYFNLANLTNLRDNQRQAVMDLLNLNASLGRLNTELLNTVPLVLDLNRIHVVGVSLGGMVGSVFAAVNQLAIDNDTRVGLLSNLHPIRGLVASAAGTQTVQLLTNSATLGPVVQTYLAGRGLAAGTAAYERFLFAAQSAADAGDPVNFTETLAASSVPVLVQQINGDPVIPNSADGAPLAGTRAMTRLLGSTQLGLGSTVLGKGHVRLTAGAHTSLVTALGSSPQVTAELQTQVTTFVLNNGGVSVGGGAPANIEPP